MGEVRRSYGGMVRTDRTVSHDAELLQTAKYVHEIFGGYAPDTVPPDLELATLAASPAHEAWKAVNASREASRRMKAYQDIRAASQPPDPVR